MPCEAFLATIPALTEKYARPGTVKFLYRHYSNSETSIEEGSYGVEAAAEQGYGWQYAYPLFVNEKPKRTASASPELKTAARACAKTLLLLGRGRGRGTRTARNGRKRLEKG